VPAMLNQIDVRARHDFAESAIQAGYKLVWTRGKRCVVKDWPNVEFTRREISWRIRVENANIAAKVDGLAVLDADGLSGLRWIEERGISSPFETLTRKGRHVWLRLGETEQEVRTVLRALGMELDLLTGANRYAMLPFSAVNGHTYSFAPGKGLVRPEELPTIGEVVLRELLAEPDREPTPMAISPLGLPEERARNYIDKLPFAVQGEGGSSSCIKAMLKILTLTGGDSRRAWELALYYNAAKCQPPFDPEIEDGPDSLKRKFEIARGWWKPSR
jgi:hypothetical protein